MALQASDVEMFLAHLLQWSNCVYVSLLSHCSSNWIIKGAKSGLTSPFFETIQIVDLKQQTKLSQQAVCPMFWKRAELITSFLALKTWYCVRNPRSQHLMIDDLISIMRGSPFFVCMFSFEIRTVPETDLSSRFAQWKLLGKANSSSLVSHMSMTTSFTTWLL